MKIGIDYAATVGNGGNSVYSQNLINALIAADQLNDYYLYAFAHDVLRGKLTALEHNKRVHLRPAYFSSLGVPLPSFVVEWLNYVSFRIWTAIDNLDIFHFTNPIYYQKGTYRKLIISIHDLGSLYNSNWSKKQSGNFFKKKIEEMVTRADKIVAVSEYTQKDILQNFKIHPNKIEVIYEAAGAVYYPETSKQELKDKFSISDYLLYVGQIQPRKNIVNIILAYSQLPNELRAKHPLVMVGSARERGYAETVNLIIVEYGLSSNVYMLGRVEDELLRKLYSGAKAFVFPSLFEGFGLPVLEALQCGTPVITSNTTSLPEVVGEAGVLVDPADINDISQAMKNILVDDSFRDNLRDHCLGQAKKFSWGKAAIETLLLYKSLHS
jgi:glycosyltransferase involved in cell wall biosynthesis